MLGITDCLNELNDARSDIGAVYFMTLQYIDEVGYCRTFRSSKFQ